MSLPYNGLATIYDGLMGDVDYRSWATYIQRLTQRYDVPGRRLLDLGCGTGTLTLLLAAAGFDVTGVDLSADMLAIAADKGLAANLSPQRWLCQDMRQLRLPTGAYHVVVCACDGFNYLHNQKDLQQTLSGIANCLTSGGLLLFDVHSEHKMRDIFDGGQFVQESESGYCIWTSEFDQHSRDCLHEMTIFLHQHDDIYRRSVERHRQHYFTPAELADAVQRAGLQQLGIFSWGTIDQPPAAADERWQVVARKA